MPPSNSIQSGSRTSPPHPGRVSHTAANDNSGDDRQGQRGCCSRRCTPYTTPFMKAIVSPELTPQSVLSPRRNLINKAAIDNEDDVREPSGCHSTSAQPAPLLPWTPLRHSLVNLSHRSPPRPNSPLTPPILNPLVLSPWLAAPSTSVTTPGYIAPHQKSLVGVLDGLGIVHSHGEPHAVTHLVMWQKIPTSLLGSRD